MRILLIDDYRNLPASVICRSGQEGIRALKDMGPWDLLLLDNDMGMESISGVEVANWLERPENASFRPESAKVVSSNPPARAVIEVIFDRIYMDSYETWDGPVFVCPEMD
ncbi:MAG: hypothetical protein MN733_41565 [Nitrososphaera sp.]|nr:hypothetical protein [Nitrososphaera sp.]